MEALVPWFFALDHTNYARVLPIHMRDMKSIFLNHFNPAGLFRRPLKGFSSIPLDQAHEQNNKIIKSVGGAVCLTENPRAENPRALKKWMISGPEQVRLLKEFEHTCNDDSVCDSSHEEGLSKQKTFKMSINYASPFLV